MTYQRIDARTGAHIGDAGDLPDALNGLEDASLANLSAALDPCPDEFKGQGFVQVDDVAQVAADKAADEARVNVAAVGVAAKGIFTPAERATLLAAMAIIAAKVPA